MCKFRSIVIAIAAVWLAPPAASADTIVCPVEADTYILHGHGGGNGYPNSCVAKSCSWVGVEALFRFDLTPLAGMTADDVTGAVFHAYTGEVDPPGMMDWPVAPAGTTQQAQVLPLRTWGDNHPYKDGFPEFPYWTEAVTADGIYADVTKGGVNGSTQATTGLPNIYDPGDVGGVDPYCHQPNGLNPATVSAVLSHVAGPDSWASVDLTEFVKAWLPGGDLDILNNGIRIHDLGGWSGSPDPEYMADYDYGWYFFGKDPTAPGSLTHPGADYIPYLEVTLGGGPVIPEPAGVVLFGLGGLAFLAMVLRRRKRHKDSYGSCLQAIRFIKDEVWR